MTLRSRRLIAALLAVVATLILGRWVVEFVVDRWWAETISPAAAGFTTGWQLLGLALEASALLIASLWFTVQALFVVRTVVSVQVAHRVGNFQFRELLPARFLVLGAIGTGVLLGLVVAAGAHTWRDSIVLAWQGVHYGVTDPLLHQDLGVYVAQLPAWDLVQRFAGLLAVLGLAFCTTLYSAIGGLRRERRSIVLHADAQRHLGLLLALVALIIASGSLLTPFHIVVDAPASLSATAGMARVHAAQALAGFAVATAVLTMWWAFRGRGSLLVATWLVLAVAAITERFIIPALTDNASAGSERLALARRFDELAWGIRVAPIGITADSTPPVTAVWDEALISRIIEQRSGVLEAATAMTVTVGDSTEPVWLAATAPPGESDHLEVLAIRAAGTAGGGPVLLRSPETARAPRAVWRTLVQPHSRPASPAWQGSTQGVALGGPLRRLMLAWARQAPGMLHVSAEPAVDWHLDPAERAASVLPMFSWLGADVLIVNGRITWVTQGLVTTAGFPLATRSVWGGESVAGVAAALVCTVDAASGETHFYIDPAADSLGLAWARVAAAVVTPASAMPLDLRNALPYPIEWFDAQASVLATSTWNVGQRPLQNGVISPTAAVWTVRGTPARQAIFEDPARQTITGIATAARVNGIPEIRLDPHEAMGATTDSRVTLRQLWARHPELAHVRDSAVAAGDSIIVGPLRWFDGRAGAIAWEPWFASPPRGGPALLWIATAVADHAAGGRTPTDAWNAVTRPDAAQAAPGPDATTLLLTARQWVQRADSALRRGDLTAFGRAFEELKRTLDTGGSP